jgi:thiol peroxidase
MTVLFKGQPAELVGPDLKVGDRAPDFTLVDVNLQTVNLEAVTANGTKNALLIVVPSLDTNVCSLESAKFNQRVGELPPDIAAYVVSRDTPFAMARWGKEQGDVKLQFLSDFRDQSFGPAYGVLIKDMGLLARAIFIIGKDKTIRYKQVVPDVGKEPDYEDVIAAASRTSSAVNA